jgi:hypothetical protein
MVLPLKSSDSEFSVGRHAVLTENAEAVDASDSEENRMKVPLQTLGALIPRRGNLSYPPPAGRSGAE